MQDVAYAFAPYFDRAIVDRTGLTGEYDFAVEFDVDASEPGPVTIPNVSGLGGRFVNPYTGLNRSALAAPLKDLGIDLKATKAEVEVLVIDHLERPSDN